VSLARHCEGPARVVNSIDAPIGVGRRRGRRVPVTDAIVLPAGVLARRSVQVGIQNARVRIGDESARGLPRSDGPMTAGSSLAHP